MGQARQLVEVTIATYVGLDKKPRRPGMSLAELWRKELDENCGQSDERRMAYARELVLKVGDGRPPEMIQRTVNNPIMLRLCTTHDFQPDPYMAAFFRGGVDLVQVKRALGI